MSASNSGRKQRKRNISTGGRDRTIAAIGVVSTDHRLSIALPWTQERRSSRVKFPERPRTIDTARSRTNYSDTPTSLSIFNTGLPPNSICKHKSNRVVGNATLR